MTNTHKLIGFLHAYGDEPIQANTLAKKFVEHQIELEEKELYTIRFYADFGEGDMSEYFSFYGDEETAKGFERFWDLFNQKYKEQSEFPLMDVNSENFKTILKKLFEMEDFRVEEVITKQNFLYLNGEGIEGEGTTNRYERNKTRELFILEFSDEQVSRAIENVRDEEMMKPFVSGEVFD